MRTKTLVFILASLLVATIVPAQTLEEVLDGYYEARGGKDALLAVGSARMQGTMAMGDMLQSDFTLEWKRPGMFRLEFTVQGQTGVQAYDGETAWMHMPFMGRSDPEVMPEEQAKEVREYADVIDGPYMNAKDKGRTLELIGKEEVEGTEAYKIKVTQEDGDVEFHFLDAEYFLPIKEQAKQKRGETEIELEATLGDYKEVDNLVFAHYMQFKAKGAPAAQTITINSIALNVDIDSSRFAMPEVEKTAEGE